MKYFFLINLLFSNSSFAYVPPAYFIAKKIVEGREKHKSPAANISIYKPAEDSKSTEQFLWEETLKLSNTASTWPIWPLLLETDSERLLTALERFGFKISREKDLLRFPLEQVSKMPAMPSPFYKRDESVNLKRLANTLVWVVNNKEKRLALYVEKDTFLPLLISGPCPEPMSTSDLCLVEISRSRKEPKIIIRNEKQVPLLVAKVEHVSNSATQSISAGAPDDDRMLKIFTAFFK